MVEGYIIKRQEYMNDMLKINHLTAGKIAEAVWGSKSFKKEFKEIKLFEDEDINDARNKKVFKFLQSKGLI